VNPPTFSGENVEIVARYERRLELKSLKQSTISLKLWNLYSLLKYYNFKPANLMTKAEIEDYVIHRRKTRKPKTVHNDIVELRMFFKWLVPDNDYFEGIKSKSPKNTLPVEQLVTPTDVTCLVNACQSQRDRAIIMLLWDSAARLNEALELKVGSIQFDNNGGVVIVNGKTGMRRIRLIDSVPDLQNWINMHPMRDDSNAPLFVTTRLYEGQYRPLNERTVQNMMKTVTNRANITKNVHPHALRHAKLTHLAKQGFSEMELRIIAGWENNSDMPAVYIHLSGADVEKKILEKNGLVEPDEEIKTLPTKPKSCPRCKTKNAYDSQYCMNCSMVLDPKKAKEIEDKDPLREVQAEMKLMREEAEQAKEREKQAEQTRIAMYEFINEKLESKYEKKEEEIEQEILEEIRKDEKTVKETKEIWKKFENSDDPDIIEGKLEAEKSRKMSPDKLTLPTIK